MLMKYIYKHYDTFKLIACCCAGMGYENYIERLTEIETKSGIALVRILRKENRMKVDMDNTLKNILTHCMIFIQQVGTKF